MGTIMAQFARPRPAAEKSVSGSSLPLCVSYKRTFRVHRMQLIGIPQPLLERKTTGCVGGAEDDRDSQWARLAIQANLANLGNNDCTSTP